jgi:CMD domain protein
MSTETRDIIDLLAGIEPGSSLYGIRARRSQARENAQGSYLALFEPDDVSNVAVAERYAVAAFVAGLHAEPATTGFYLEKFALEKFASAVDRPEQVAVLKREIDRAKTHGPYGAFPTGPLSVEDKAGLIYRVAGESQRALGAKLAAALEHTHLLVFHPRDASSAALQSLLDAGWSSTAIVTLSQLVAFLSFQIRTVAGLRMLSASPGHRTDPSAKAG